MKTLRKIIAWCSGDNDNALRDALAWVLVLVDLALVWMLTYALT